LGLPLVRGLVQLHGGQVEARSPGPGGGSEFVVSLPLKRAAAPPRRQARGRGATAAGRAPAAGGLRVLVVEDNLDGRESLRELLELWGYAVDLAASSLRHGAEASERRPATARGEGGSESADGGAG